MSVKWKNRAIGDLSPQELREALGHALHEMQFARDGTSSNDFFATVVVSYLAGAVTVLLAVAIAVKLA